MAQEEKGERGKEESGCSCSPQFLVPAMECAKSRASFFKVMMDCYNETLVVPQKFARIWGSLLGKTTHLEDSDGRRWAVRVSEVNGRLSFQQGWDEFVDQHSIAFGEFLVFTYSRRSSFAVQIFGTSGCERRHFPRTARATEESVAQRLVRRKSSASRFLRRNGEKSEKSASICGRVPANLLSLDHQIAPLIVLGDDEGEEEENEKKKKKKKKKKTPANLLALDHQIAPLSVLGDNGGEEEENGKNKTKKKKTPANLLTLDHQIAPLSVLGDDEGEEEENGKNKNKNKKKNKKKKTRTPANLLTLDHQIAPLTAVGDDEGEEEENGKKMEKKKPPANLLTLDPPIASLIVLSDDEGEEEQNGMKMKKKKKPARILRSARAQNKAHPAMASPDESSGRSTHRSKREHHRGAP